MLKICLSYYPKTIQKLSKNYPKTIQKLSKSCPKAIRKLTKNYAKTIQELSKNYPKTIQKFPKNYPKIFQKTIQIQKCQKNRLRISFLYFKDKNILKFKKSELEQF